MKSGILAAEAIFNKIDDSDEMFNFEELVRASWLWTELHKVRNIRPSFKWGFWKAIAYSAIDTYF